MGLFGLLFFRSVRGVYSLLYVSVCRVESVSCHVYPLPVPCSVHEIQNMGAQYFFDCAPGNIFMLKQVCQCYGSLLIFHEQCYLLVTLKTR